MVQMEFLVQKASKDPLAQMDLEVFRVQLVLLVKMVKMVTLEKRDIKDFLVHVVSKVIQGQLVTGDKLVFLETQVSKKNQSLNFLH